MAAAVTGKAARPARWLTSWPGNSVNAPAPRGRSACPNPPLGGQGRFSGRAAPWREGQNNLRSARDARIPAYSMPELSSPLPAGAGGGPCRRRADRAHTKRREASRLVGRSGIESRPGRLRGLSAPGALRALPRGYFKKVIGCRRAPGRPRTPAKGRGEAEGRSSPEGPRLAP